MQKAGNRQTKKRILTVCAVIAAAFIALCLMLVLGEHPAEEAAISASRAESDAVRILQPEKNMLVFYPEKPEAGLIFYPGAKVEYISYSPLMQKLAHSGILCILVKMPLNNALLNMNAADSVLKLYPEIGTWYIGGHSLGGAAAAMYLRNRSEAFDGILLLASFSSADLSRTGLKAISVYGDKDGVLNRSSYEKYYSNLPPNVQELVIPGGNHAQFGSYGAQRRDGAAEISSEEQLEITAGFCLRHMLSE